MSNGILSGLRVVEGSAFVAAPLGGLLLTQLGAEVIRFDQIGGGLDYQRWPLSLNGQSLFWTGLNRGKKSIEIDLRSEAGREIARNLITAPGKNAGIFLTNFPASGWLDFSSLKAMREDLIMVVLQGNYDGTSEVDYTVNPAMGFPLITGSEGSHEPTNSVLPAWDLVLGHSSAISILASERRRKETGEGNLSTIALSDVALSAVSSLGRLSQAELTDEQPQQEGNYLYGAFGHNFATSDGREIMIVALTQRQWTSLIKVTDLSDVFQKLEKEMELNFIKEGDRFRARHQLFEVIKGWVGVRNLASIRDLFDSSGVSWGPYQSFKQLLHEDPRSSTQNPLIERVVQPGLGSMLSTQSPIRFPDLENEGAKTAPALGEHTDQILSEILGLNSHEIGKLHDDGIVGGNYEN